MTTQTATQTATQMTTQMTTPTSAATDAPAAAPAAVAAAAAALAGRPGLAELCEQIRRCIRPGTGPRVTARLVAGVLTDLRPTAQILTQTERQGSADGYARHTLHTEADFSISAVVWRPGQITEIHDHLVWCSFLVLAGTETENIFAADGDRLIRIGQRQRPAGSVSGVAPPDDIHQVHNTDDTVAITLHVYGADLSRGTSVRRTYGLHVTP